MNRSPDTPESVVQRQLDAYNAREIEALMATYAEDAQQFEYPATLLAQGAAQIRERTAARFTEPNLHARLIRRIVTGHVVIDQEVVTRTFPEGPGKLELVAIYEVREGRIASARFINGAKTLDLDSGGPEAAISGAVGIADAASGPNLVEDVQTSPAPADIRIRRVTNEPSVTQALADVLLDCVEGGASVGFMQPLPRAKAIAFWEGVLASAARGERILLVAEDTATRTIVGTVQVLLNMPDNQPHRADIAKMQVHRSVRRRGVGAALLGAAEAAAQAAGRTLLVLDTVQGSAGERLYTRLGWQRCGVIPGYALWPQGGPCNTTVFYRDLTPARPSNANATLLWRPRLAREPDIPALEELIPLSVRELQAPYYTAAQMEAALGTVFAVDRQLILDGTYYVVEQHGAIVGAGGWSRRRSLYGGDRGRAGEDPLLDPRNDAARVRAFFVHPAWARRGIGRSIMTACEQAVVAAGFRTVEMVATLAGEPLYAAFGYAVVERYDIPMAGGLGLPVVRMTKRV